MSDNANVRDPRPFPMLRSFPASLERTGGPPEGRLRGQVVGTVGRERIIVCGLEAGALKLGDEVVVRMAVGSEVLGFHTKVLEAGSSGTALFMLAIPESVESLNLRKAERMSLFVLADVQLGHSKPKTPAGSDLALLQGILVNLSRGGCCLSTKRSLSVDEPIRLVFMLPGSRHSNRIDAKVLRHMDHSRAGVFMHGLQFDAPSEQAAVLGNVDQWITQNLPFALSAGN
jgi:hypothetical protein